jgi:vesicle-associated membrane protein 7
MILLSSIVENSVGAVVCQYSTPGDSQAVLDWSAIIQSVLIRLEPSTTADKKLSFPFDEYLVHCSIQNDYTYLCIAAESFGRRIPFALLDSLQQRFQRYLQSGNHPSALSTGSTHHKFSDFANTTMRQLVESYSTDTSVPSALDTRVRRVQGELDQVRDVMSQNIERVMERGEKLDVLIDKTDTLNQAAFAFRQTSTALKRRMWWRNTRITVLLIVITVVAIYLLVCAGCGFPGWRNCVS